MATLVEVFSELFRSFGYRPTLQTDLEGVSGRRHPVPLVLDRDTRRIAVTVWTHRQPLGPAYLDEFLEAVKDTGCDGGLVVSLGAVPETLLVHAGRNRVQVWDSRRATQELGSAVLRETSPGTWEQSDPLLAARPSRILDQVHAGILQAETLPSAAVAPTVPASAPATDPVAEPMFPAMFEPVLATPAEAAPTTFQAPLAFGVLDAAVATEPAPPAVNAPAPIPVVAPPTPWPVAPPARPSRNLLRVQVNRNLAASMAKPKTRTTDRIFLRLVPFHVFDYEAQLLVEGSLQSERRTGRMAVDAALKRVRPWTHPLETSDLGADGSDVDEKPIRLSEGEARKLLMTELRPLVTRDVVLQEDDSEWSVVVKKKVELADEELRLASLGIYWMPVWRVSGKDGALEIDAVTGAVLHEELMAPASDAQLI